MDRETLKRTVTEWLSKGSKHTSISNTELYVLIAKNYEVNPEDFGFKTPQGSYIGHSFPERMDFDTFDEFLALMALCKTIGGETFNKCFILLYDALFTKDGWAQEHNYLLLEMLRSNPTWSCSYRSYYKPLSPTVVIDSECQFVYVELNLKFMREFEDFPKGLYDVLASNERLLHAFEDRHLVDLKSRDLNYLTYFLHGKPKRSFPEDYKCILSDSWRSDFTRLELILQDSLESAKLSWPKKPFEHLEEMCRKVFTGYNMDRKFVMAFRTSILKSASSKTLAFLFSSRLLNCDEVSKEVMEVVVQKIDFGHLAHLNQYALHSLVHECESAREQFYLHGAIEDVSKYIRGTDYPYNEASIMQELSKDRFRELLMAGAFVGCRFDLSECPSDDDQGFSAIEDCEYAEDNAERLLLEIPSGRAATGQALVSLIMDNNTIPEKVRNDLLNRRLFDRSSFEDCPEILKPLLFPNGESDDWSVSLRDALKDLPLDTIVNNVNVAVFIGRYLKGKIEMGTATADDLSIPVLMALCLHCSDRIKSF